MSSDIKLGDDERVIIEGTYLEVRTTDIFLDNPERRSADANPSIPRRALVHDFNDGLTLNYNADYPGGVTIRGDVNIPRRLYARNIEFELEGLSTFITPVDPVIDVLVHPRKRVDLKQVIYEFQKEIAALKERVASLEKST